VPIDRSASLKNLSEKYNEIIRRKNCSKTISKQKYLNEIKPETSKI
jgi:hypothetical protein